MCEKIKIGPGFWRGQSRSRVEGKGSLARPPRHGPVGGRGCGIVLLVGPDRGRSHVAGRPPHVADRQHAAKWFQGRWLAPNAGWIGADGVALRQHGAFEPWRGAGTPTRLGRRILVPQAKRRHRLVAPSGNEQRIGSGWHENCIAPLWRKRGFRGCPPGAWREASAVRRESGPSATAKDARHTAEPPARPQRACPRCLSLTERRLHL